MLTEFHCLCGFRSPIEVSALAERVRCGSCGEEFSFRHPNDKSGKACWLIVGGSKGPPRLAVPIPREKQLTIGSAPDGWLVLPSDDVAPKHADLTLRDDLCLVVRHVSGAAGTWINRARILSGVVHEKDTLRVGPFVMALRKQSQLVEILAASAREIVIVEEEDSEFSEKPLARGAARGLDDAILVDETPKRPTIRIAASIGIIILAGGLLARTYLWPGVSQDMPSDTEYRCPVDGAVFRADWGAGPAKCPQCGQLCFGSLGFMKEPPGGRPLTTSQAESTADSDYSKPKGRQNHGAGGP